MPHSGSLAVNNPFSSLSTSLAGFFAILSCIICINIICIGFTGSTSPIGKFSMVFLNASAIFTSKIWNCSAINRIDHLKWNQNPTKTVNTHAHAIRRLSIMPPSCRHRFLIVVPPAFRRIIFLFMWVVRSTTSVCSIARVNANQRFAAASAPFGATVIYTPAVPKTRL